MAVKLLIFSGVIFVVFFVVSLFAGVKGAKDYTVQSIMALGVIAVFGVWVWYFKYYQASIDGLASGERDRCINQSSAYYESQRFVRENLKSPDSAEFPIEAGINVKQSDACRFVISAKVDAMNSFGAKVRSSYIVDLSFQRKYNRYKLNAIEIK